MFVLLVSVIANMEFLKCYLNDIIMPFLLRMKHIGN